jgi:hypothetical protein
MRVMRSIISMFGTGSWALPGPNISPWPQASSCSRSKDSSSCSWGGPVGWRDRRGGKSAAGRASREGVRRAQSRPACAPGRARSRRWDQLHLGVAPALVLDLAVVEVLVADDDPVRDADQLHVREHEAGAGVAVVEQHLDADRGAGARRGPRPPRARGTTCRASSAAAPPRTGAMAAGQQMPRSSWCCSMAAATTRETPMP